MEPLQSTYEKLFNAFKIKTMYTKYKHNDISYPLIRTRTGAYKRVRNACFIGKFCVRTL